MVSEARTRPSCGTFVCVAQPDAVVAGTTRDGVVAGQVFRTQVNRIVTGTQIGTQIMIRCDINRIVAVAGIDDGHAVGRAVVGIAGRIAGAVDFEVIVATTEGEVMGTIAVDDQRVITVAHVDGMTTIAM